MKMPKVIETAVRIAVRKYVQTALFRESEWTRLYTGVPSSGEKFCCHLTFCKGERLRVRVIETLPWWKSAASFSIDVETPGLESVKRFPGLESEEWFEL